MVEFQNILLEGWLKDNLKDDTSFKVIGQIEGSQFIVTWTRSSPNNGITYLATADISSPIVKILIQVEGTFDVCQASLNSNKNILALVVREKLINDGSSSSNASENCYSFQAFAVQRFPEFQKKDFSWVPLTDVHTRIIQCHFLSAKGNSAKKLVTVEKQEDSLVVLIHRHSIQLHRILHNEIFCLGGSRVLVLDFHWSHWLQEQQCLAYLCVNASDDKPVDEIVLYCVQFFGNNQPSNVFSISGPEIGIKHLNSSSSEPYNKISINVISGDKMNLSLILQNSGNVCICYQPHIDDIITSDLVSSYYITMLHHGCQIKAAVSTKWLPQTWPLTFVPTCGNQLLVLSQNGPAHIVDTDPAHKPGYYIITTEPSWPAGMKHCTSVVTLSESGQSILLQREPFSGFWVSISIETLVSIFCTTKSTSNRKSIIHFISTHHKDKEDFLKILKTLVHDPWNIEISYYLEEYLIGSTFAKVKEANTSCHGLLYHLPMNICEETDCCDVAFSVTYKREQAMPTDSLLMSSSCGLSLESSFPTSTDVWHSLWHHQFALYERSLPGRIIIQQFDLPKISKVLQTPADLRMKKESFSQSLMPVKTPRQSLSDLCSLCIKTSSATSSLLSLPPDVAFSPPVVDLPFPSIENDSIEIESVGAAVWRELQNHLHLCCSFATSSSISKVASDFVLCQSQQSQFLCSMIFEVFGIVHKESKPAFHYIGELSETKLFVLQSMLERFLLSCKHLSFVLPSGFNGAFAAVSFRTMNFLRFMQHVQNKAVILQPHSVRHMIKALDNCPENVEKKLYLIGYLPKDEGEMMLMKWDHAIANKYRSHRRAREILSIKDNAGPDVQLIGEERVDRFGALSMDSADYAVAATEDVNFSS